MRPLVVVVEHVLVENTLKTTPTPDQHPVQTLLSDRPHPALGDRIGVRRLRGNAPGGSTRWHRHTRTPAALVLNRSRAWPVARWTRSCRSVGRGDDQAWRRSDIGGSTPSPQPRPIPPPSRRSTEPSGRRSSGAACLRQWRTSSSPSWKTTGAACTVAGPGLACTRPSSAMPASDGGQRTRRRPIKPRPGRLRPGARRSWWAPRPMGNAVSWEL